MIVRTPFKNGIPGIYWMAGFQKRHTDKSLHTSTPLNYVRTRMLKKIITNAYFNDLNDVLNSIQIEPKRIWNIYETIASLTHKPSRVLAECCQRKVPGRVGNSRDGVSVLACINAEGEDIPPMVIVKRLTESSLNAYNLAEGPPECKYIYQKNAWIKDVFGVAWFKDPFLLHCGLKTPKSSFLTVSFHDTLGQRDNNIALFALPPHTTQFLNPLDNTVFGPFQRSYNSICTVFVSSLNHMVTKWE